MQQWYLCPRCNRYVQYGQPQCNFCGFQIIWQPLKMSFADRLKSAFRILSQNTPPVQYPNPVQPPPMYQAPSPQQAPEQTPLYPPSSKLSQEQASVQPASQVQPPSLPTVSDTGPVKEPPPPVPDQPHAPDLPPVAEDKLKSIIGIPFESQKPIKATQSATPPTQPAPQEAIAGEPMGYRQDRKDVGTAYLYWLCLGMHYRYLDRKDTQIIFWATLGGIGLWWLWDMVRLPDMVRDYNIDLRLKAVMREETMNRPAPPAEKEIKVHQRNYQARNPDTYKRHD